MNWDQIERNWAAMTRRVRADWPLERGEPRRGGVPADAAAPLPERRTAMPPDVGLRLSAE